MFINVDIIFLFFHTDTNYMCACVYIHACTKKKILFDRRYDEQLSVYSRFVGMTI